MEAFVIVEVAPHMVALPARQVEQVLRMVSLTPVPQPADRLDGTLDLHGELVPVLSLRACLGVPRLEPRPDAHLVVARAGEIRVALHVDRVVDLAVVEPESVVATTWTGTGIRAAVRLAAGVALLAALETLVAEVLSRAP